MANKIQSGSFGRVRVFEDFLGLGTSNGAWAATGVGAIGGLAFTSVNEGSFAHTVDEPGGIVCITTDTADNDNCALYAGVFKPADGGCVMEVRFKIPALTTKAIFCGFSETLSATTPVMPAEFATATLDFVATGNVVGFVHDSDATTADWRAAFGNDNVAVAGSDANGTRAYEAPVADEWDIMRIEVGADGDAYCYLNGRLVKKVADAVTTTDVLHAVFMIEDRVGSGSACEVDYFYAEGGRDWIDS
uniref:Uncharacterized protein n=1 Tax=viral metagenome TaxID=1070528 RepID=A0A6M3K026_9ZZZZ